MTKRVRRIDNVPRPLPDIGVAVICGDAYVRSARRIVSLIPLDMTDAAKYGALNLGEMAVAATNLALALELYLKAQITQTGAPFPEVHPLSQLYALISKEVREKVERNYGPRVAALNLREASGFKLQINKAETDRPFDADKPHPAGVKALLQRSARTFVTWRYLFAHGETISGEPLSFEYAPLLIVAEELRSHFAADLAMREKQSSARPLQT